MKIERIDATPVQAYRIESDNEDLPDAVIVIYPHGNEYYMTTLFAQIMPTLDHCMLAVQEKAAMAAQVGNVTIHGLPPELFDGSQFARVVNDND